MSGNRDAYGDAPDRVWMVLYRISSAILKQMITPSVFMSTKKDTVWNHSDNVIG